MIYIHGSPTNSSVELLLSTGQLCDSGTSISMGEKVRNRYISDRRFEMTTHPQYARPGSVKIMYPRLSEMLSFSLKKAKRALLHFSLFSGLVVSKMDWLVSAHEP